MAKTKGKPTENQYSKDDCDDLVKEAESATASLYPLRREARNLREDIDEVDDVIACLEEDIRNYVGDIGNRINEKREELRLFSEATKREIAEMEAATKKRLKDIDEEKEEMGKQRTRAQEQAQLLRVKLGELERNILSEATQKQKIIELKDILVRIKIKHDQVLQDLKAEFTRDLRKMRRDYEEKMSLTNKYAKNLLIPCLTEIVDNMRDENTRLARYMHRISQNQGVLFKKISEIEGVTNHLRCEYELWKDIESRKMFGCDPRLPPARNCSLERDAILTTCVESQAQVDVISSLDKINKVKVTPYEKRKDTLRSLLGSEDGSAECDVNPGRENQDSDEGGSTGK